jgi:ribosomal protein S18 acetylase RimI-like enzyme
MVETGLNNKNINSSHSDTSVEEPEVLIGEDPKLALQSGLLSFCRNLGLIVNSVAGGLLINASSVDPLIGGMMFMDWSQGNIQESPLVIDHYYSELQKPYVWWNEPRQVPENFDQRLKALGLKFIETRYSLFRETEQKNVRLRPTSLARSHYRFKGIYCDEMIASIAQKDLSPSSAHYVGYFNGKAITAGSLYNLGNHAFITNLCTEKSSRDQGFASMMLEELIASARIMGYKDVCTQTPENLVEYFKKRGFSSCYEFNIYGSEKIKKDFIASLS